MNDDYLWNPRAKPDAEIVALERMLAPLLEPPPVRAMPAAAPARSRWAIPAIAMLVAALVVLWWALGDRERGQQAIEGPAPVAAPSPEPPAVPARTAVPVPPPEPPPTTVTPGLRDPFDDPARRDRAAEDPHPKSPFDDAAPPSKPTAPAPLDPFDDTPRSPAPQGEILDPFADRPPAPPVPRGKVVDPFTDRPSPPAPQTEVLDPWRDR